METNCPSKLGQDQCILKAGHTCRHRWRGMGWIDDLVKQVRNNDPLFQIKKLATEGEDNPKKALEDILEVIWSFEYSTHLDN